MEKKIEEEIVRKPVRMKVGDEWFIPESHISNSHKAVLESVRDMVEGKKCTASGRIDKRSYDYGYEKCKQDILKEIDQALSEVNIK